MIPATEIPVTESDVETPPSIDRSISAGRRRTGRTSGRTSQGAGGRGVHWTRAQPPHPASIFGRKYTSASSRKRWK